MKKKRSAKRTVLTVLGILLLLIFLVAACAMIYLNHVLNKINRVGESEHTLSSSEADNFLYSDPDLITIDPNVTETYVNLEDITFGTISWDPTVPVAPTGTTQAPEPTEESVPTQPSETDPTQPENTQPPATEATEPATQPEDTPSSTDVIFGDHVVNIMLVGQDRKEGQGRQRSDTMILVTLNKSNNTITLTSFMRDQYVQIPGYKPNKLNAAYAFGGMSLLSKTLELNFGVKVDGVVEVDFGGFEQVIDLLGGVNVTLTKAEAKYLNDLYEVKLVNSPVVEGGNCLDGKSALVYARLREIDSDYHRAYRQRQVILGLIEAYKNQPLDKMLSLLDEILPLVTTNLSNTEILSYVVEFFPMLSSAKIQTLRIPVDGTYVDGTVKVREGFYGWFQYNIDFEANKKVLWEVFRRRD